MEELLEKLVLLDRSDFMPVVEKFLSLIGKTDLLNEIKMFCKYNPISYIIHVFYYSSLQF